MQKSIFSAALTAVAILSVGFKEPETPASLTQQQLNEQSVLALNWVQQSGEYAALTDKRIKRDEPMLRVTKTATDRSVKFLIIAPSIQPILLYLIPCMELGS